MLIAFLSDIHGNLPALEAAAADSRARGARRLYCAGDLTGYGPFPDGVCRFLEKRRIPAILGNYDQKVRQAAESGVSSAARMKPKKKEILLWTADHLGGKARRYLAALPETLELRLPGGVRLLMVHGSPVSAEDTIYPSVTPRGLEKKLRGDRPDILVCGHTHIPFLKRMSGIFVVNCGSAGHPVDGDPRPSYALVEVGRKAVPRGQIVRFEYDRDRILAVLKKTSLPKGLRRDFAEGNKMRFLE